jgi:hypothetical protein
VGAGRIEKCTTFADEPAFLLCDGTFIELQEETNCFMAVHAEAMRRTIPFNKEAVRQTCHKNNIAAARQAGKTFLLQFSQIPWPEPGKDCSETNWKCTKKDEITCTFLDSANLKR